MELQDNFEMLADADMWLDVAAVGGGYLGANVAQSVGDGVSPVDVPNEAYGLGVAVAGFAVDMDGYGRQVAVGGGLYAVDNLTQRFEIRDEIMNYGG